MRKSLPYIGVDVVIGVIVLLVPMIIRGLFSILLFAMTNPLEMLVMTSIALVAYSVGLYLGENK